MTTNADKIITARQILDSALPFEQKLSAIQFLLHIGPYASPHRRRREERDTDQPTSGLRGEWH